MKKLSQLDPRWASEKIGNTNLTIGRWGCLITSICMLWSRFYPSGSLMPSEAAKEWNFVQKGKNAGSLYWNSHFDGMIFDGRYYGEPNKKVLKEYMTKKKGIVFEVNKEHWVVGYYNGFLGTYCIDPLDRKRKNIKKHYTITGYALFSKAEA